jgi:hypothetical protein
MNHLYFYYLILNHFTKSFQKFTLLPSEWEFSLTFVIASLVNIGARGCPLVFYCGFNFHFSGYLLCETLFMYYMQIFSFVKYLSSFLCISLLVYIVFFYFVRILYIYSIYIYIKIISHYAAQMASNSQSSFLSSRVLGLQARTIMPASYIFWIWVFC